MQETDTGCWDAVRYNGARARRPQAERWDWQELIRVLCWVRTWQRAKIDVPAWGPVRMLPGTTRAAKNVQSVSMLVLDCDQGESIEVLEALGDEYARLGHTSWSHSQQHPKARLISRLLPRVPLSTGGKSGALQRAGLLHTGSRSISRRRIRVGCIFCPMCHGSQAPSRKRTQRAVRIVVLLGRRTARQLRRYAEQASHAAQLGGACLGVSCASGTAGCADLDRWPSKRTDGRSPETAPSFRAGDAAPPVPSDDRCRRGRKGSRHWPQQPHIRARSPGCTSGACRRDR